MPGASHRERKRLERARSATSIEKKPFRMRNPYSLSISNSRWFIAQ